MASRSDLCEFSSPIKRRRLDSCENVTNRSQNQDYSNYSVVKKARNGKFEDNNEDNCDSGFTDLRTVSDDQSPDSQQSKSPRKAIGLDSEDCNSSDSTASEMSGISDISGLDWKPMAGPMSWVQKQMLTGANPRDVLNQLAMTNKGYSDIDDMSLWRLIINMLTEPPRRNKLSSVNTLEDVVDRLKIARNIIVLTGAGVSVSCGIPDFRSRDGIYARLAIDFPHLPDPHSMFDINYFYHDPRPFFKFAREIYPGQFKPSPCHRFIKLLESQKKLLRNYSQNIDTLEQVAGIQNVIECHGSFATASCTRCKHKVTADEIRDDIFNQKIPVCPICVPDKTNCHIQTDSSDIDYSVLVTRGIMKPDIVFFGEGLPEAFHNKMAEDKDKCDLLIVIGSSLKVRPVGLIPSSIPSNVPQILINREPLEHLNFDVELLGDSDVIINQLCHMMGGDWKDVCWMPESLKETNLLVPPGDKSDLWTSQSRDSSNFSLNILDPKTVSVDSQDSLVTVEPLNNDCTISDICISPFQAGHMENNTLLQMSINSTRDSGFCLSDSNLEIGSDSNSGIQMVSDEIVCNIINSEIKSTLQSSDVQYLEDNQVVPESDICRPMLRLNSTEINVNQNTVGQQMSTVNTESHSSKERHLSIDSARDSGIGDGNSVDSISIKPRMMCSETTTKSHSNRGTLENRGTLADLLPVGTYYLHQPSRYIFPGAEVSFEHEDEWGLSDIDRESESSSESDTESESANNSGPVLSDDNSTDDTDWVQPPIKKLKNLNEL